MLIKYTLMHFQQESTAGGECRRSIMIVDLINSGVLIVNYIGHGGRLVGRLKEYWGLTEINNFNNSEKLLYLLQLHVSFQDLMIRKSVSVRIIIFKF